MLQVNTKVFIKELYEINNHIFDLYEILIRMEKDHEKDTKPYQSILSLLTSAIQEEKALLGFFELNLDLAEPFFNSLNIESSFGSAIDVIIKQNRNELINFRIANALFRILYQNNAEFFFDNMSESIFSYLQDEDNAKAYHYLYDMQYLFQSSTLIRLSGFINEIADEPTNDKTANFLRNAKYFLAFINQNIENIYLSNNFDNVPNTFNSDIKNNYANAVSEEFESTIKSSFGHELMNHTIHHLPGNEDMIKTNQDVAHLITYMALLKVSLLFLDPELHELFYLELTDYYSEDHPCYQIIENIFSTYEDTYNLVNRDLNKPPAKS